MKSATTASSKRGKKSNQSKRKQTGSITNTSSNISTPLTLNDNIINSSISSYKSKQHVTSSPINKSRLNNGKNTNKSIPVTPNTNTTTNTTNYNNANSRLIEINPSDPICLCGPFNLDPNLLRLSDTNRFSNLENSLNVLYQADNRVVDNRRNYLNNKNTSTKADECSSTDILSYDLARDTHYSCLELAKFKLVSSMFDAMVTPQIGNNENKDNVLVEFNDHFSRSATFIANEKLINDNNEVDDSFLDDLDLKLELTSSIEEFLVDQDQDTKEEHDGDDYENEDEEVYDSNVTNFNDFALLKAT